MLRLAVVGVSCLFLGCASTSSDKAATVPSSAAAAMPTAGAADHPGATALYVKGMGCPLCATNVKKSLEKVPGVAAVNIDLKTGIVKVSARADQAPEEPALKKAVADAGFELSKVERL